MSECTHPRLTHWFGVADNSYHYACAACLKHLTISSFEAIRYPRQQWPLLLVERVTYAFGPIWGDAAYKWLLREEIPYGEKQEIDEQVRQLLLTLKNTP